MEREERKVMGSGKVAITPQRKRGKSQRPSPNNVLYHVQLLKRIISNEAILFYAYLQRKLPSFFSFCLELSQFSRQFFLIFSASSEKYLFHIVAV